METKTQLTQSERRTKIINLKFREHLKTSEIAKTLGISIRLVNKDLQIVKSERTQRLQLEYLRNEFIDDYNKHMNDLQNMVDYAYAKADLNEGQVSVGFLGHAITGKRALLDSMHKKAETLQKYGLVPPFDRSQTTNNVNLTEENQVIIQRIVNLWSTKNGIETAKPIEVINR